MRCQRADGTFYGTSGKCRQGTEVAAADWREKFAGRGGPELQSEIAKMSAALESLPEEEREKNWDQWISKSFLDQRTVHRDGSPYSKEELDASLLSQARAWNSMIAEGPPRELQNRIGEKRAAPDGMIPDVSSAGQRKWISPDDGLKYSGGKNGVWRQNRVSKGDTLRRLPDITDFRKEQQAKGGAWPTQNLPPRPDLETNPDKLLASLTAKEKRAIVFNGLDASGNEGVRMRRWYDEHPEEKEARLREVVERYIAQGGRSGVSGKPIALPGLEPKPGEERSSVDHFQPISTNRSANLPPDQVRKLADNGKNFLMTEEGPNSQRGARDWGDWLDKQEREQSGGGGKAAKSPAAAPAAPKAAKAPAPTRSTAAKPPLTAEQSGTKAMLSKRIEQWADRFNVSPDTVRGDEDLLRAALGSKYKTWLGLSDRD